jgi:FtsH-binding integral membrane protein
MVRLGQLVSLLRGDHLWYLGEVNADSFAPWLFLVLLLLAGVAWLSGRRKTGAAGQRPFTPGLPLALLALIALQSAFTVSDLFITHLALVTPLIPLAAGLALAEVVRWAQATRSTASRAAAVGAALLLVGWIASDANTVVHYHRALATSGGYSAHSDAIYHLAEYLDQQRYTSPAALDWGIDAPVHFLTKGRVQPVDVFGYDRLDAPDAGFRKRMKPYLDNWESIYVTHAPDKTVFKGRVEVIEGEAAAIGFRWLEQIRFGQRSGEPVFMVNRFQH